MLVRLSIVLAAALLAAPAALSQQTLAEKCAGQESGLAPEFSAWTSRAPMRAAAGPSGIPAAELKAGQSYTATLQPMTGVEFLTEPGKSGTPSSSGGLFEIIVTEPGTFVIALGAGAWVDVVSGGASVASTGHGHGPECSTIRKIVDFPLKRGRHVVQIAGSPATDITIMVARRT